MHNEEYLPNFHVNPLCYKLMNLIVQNNPDTDPHQTFFTMMLRDARLRKRVKSPRTFKAVERRLHLRSHIATQPE